MDVQGFLGSTWENDNIPLYLTDPLSELNLNYFPNAYYIGYINSSNISSYHQLSSWEKNDNTLRITSDLESSNVPVGLMGDTQDSGSAQGSVLFDTDLELYQQQDSRFVEKVEFAKYAISPMVSLGFVGVCRYGTESIDEHIVHVGSYSAVNWFDFKAGQTAMPYSEVNSGASGGFFYNDIDGNYVEISGSNEHGVYQFELYLAYVKPQASGSTITGITSLFPTLWYENLGYGIPQNWYWKGWEWAITSGAGGSWYYNVPLIINYPLWTFSEGESLPYDTIPSGKIPFKVNSAVDRETINHIPQEDYRVFGDVMYYKYSSNYVFVIPLINIDEVEKLYYWGLKITDDATQYYGNDVWYPEMNGDKYVGNLIHVANQAEAEEVLEEFQQEGEEITEVNDFKEEDIPPAPDEPIIPDDENPDLIIPEEKGDEGDIPFNTFTPNGFSNFSTNYILSSGGVAQLGHRLWTTLQSEPAAQANFFTITDPTATYELTNANIIDYLVSLKWYPFNITQYCTSYEQSNIYIGSGTYAYDTPGARVATKIVGYIPGGTVSIPYETNTFVDFEPYSSASIFIPFCGTVEIPPSKIRGRTIQLNYYVDYMTGGCTGYISTITKGGGSIPLASLEGTMGFEMLLTGNNAQVMAAKAYQQNNARRLNEIQALTGGIIDAVGGLISSKSGGGEKSLYGGSGGSKDVSWGSIGSIAKAIGNVAFQGAQAQNARGTQLGTSPLHIGSPTTLSCLAYLQPFVMIYRHPIYNKGTGYGSIGYISDKPILLSSLKADTFFTCVNPKLSNINATSSELAAITSLLTTGVYK